MGDDKPVMPYLTKASSEADAKDVPILLWKPHQYNSLGNGHSEFIIGEVTIPVMTLSKTAPAYFPTTSSAILYGNMALIIRDVDTYEFLVLSTALWKIPTGADMTCLCHNAACPLRLQWQSERIWYLVHYCTNPTNPCNGSHVP